MNQISHVEAAMKAIVFPGEGSIEIRDVARPIPGPDEVLLQVRASGMCGTDLHNLLAPQRTEDQIFIQGHEPCGVVVEVGSAVKSQEASIGDRVMVHHYDGCRVCEHCRSGWTQFCIEESTVFGGYNGHGSHAEFMKVPAHTLVRLPDNLSFKAGAAIACGTGTAYAAIKRADIRGTETVAIFGQGPVGLSCTLFAKAMGARVIAIDIDQERLELAKGFGADVLLNAADPDLVNVIKAHSRNGFGVDKSLECSSNIKARESAVECVRPWGLACMVGVRGRIEFEVAQLIRNHKTVIGSWTFSKNIQQECAEFVAERGIDLDVLFTHEFKLEDARVAYDLFLSKKMGKGVFVF